MTGYIIKSCKTPNRDDAYRFALDLYESLRIKVLAGEAINAPSVSRVIDEFLLTQKSKSANRYKDIDTSIGKHFRSYAEGQEVDWLDSLSIVGFLTGEGNRAGTGKRQVRTLFIVNRVKCYGFFVGVRTGNICGKFPPLRSRVARMSAVLPLIGMIGIR